LNSQGSGFEQTYKDHKFLLPINTFEHNASNTLKITCKFLGRSMYKEIPISVDKNYFKKLDLPGHPSILPESVYEVKNTIVVPEGNHYFINNAVIPYDKQLLVEGGANLFFNKDSALISHGPIKMNGMPHNRITLSSNSSSFPGVYLHSTSGDSYFKNVDFTNVSGIGTRTNPYGIELNGWDLTGGITTYKSTVSFNNCSFKNFTTEDTINVISASFTVIDSNFSEIYSDAIDGDFVTGKIIRCNFSDISRDGVDFSGSVATVEDCSFTNISDKAISVGENSQVKVFDCSIENSSFGIVSKDYSSVEVYRPLVFKAQTADFAAFQKKNLFGPASIKVINPSCALSEKNFLIQVGSSGWLDEKVIISIPFVSNELYQNKKTSIFNRNEN